MLLAVALHLDEVNLAIIGKLEAGHLANLGILEPTTVRTTPIKVKAVLVSGHDLMDLKTILEQTESKCINIYTHSEVLRCNEYHQLKKTHILSVIWVELGKESSLILQNPQVLF